MKNLFTYLKALWGAWGNLQSSVVGFDCRRSDLRRSPSGLDAKWMLKLVSVFAIMLTIGVGHMLGAEGDVNYSLTFTQLSAGSNNESYTDDHSITVSSKGWTVRGNQTNGAYLCVGGKNNSATDRAMYSTSAIGSTVIGKVRVTTGGKGGTGTLTFSKIVLEVASNSTFTTIIDTKTINSPSQEGNIDFTPTTPLTSWPAGSYYRITYTYKNSRKDKNVFVKVNSVTFYEGASALYEVTYNAGSGSCATDSWTQTSVGQSTTLPTATPCSGWTFAGWCTSTAGSSATNTTSPGVILTGSYTPTDDVTLYAVYTKSEGGGSSNVTFNFGYADDWGQSGSWSGTSKDEVSATKSGVTITYTRNGSNLYANSTSIRFYQKNTLTFEAAKLITAISFTVSTYQTDITSDVGTCTATSSELSWSGNSNSVTFTRPTDASSYAQMSAATITISNATIYYMTNATCCTPLGTINGSVSLSQLASPDPTKLKATWTMNAETGIASYDLEVYNNSDVLVKTINGYSSGDEITGLNPCTTYYVKLYTVSEGSPYCAGGLISTSTTCTTNGWGVSETLTLTSHQTGASTACPGENYVATYRATSTNVLPDNVAVSIGGVAKTQGTHYNWSVSDGTGTLTVLAANITNSTGAIEITVTSTAPSGYCISVYNSSNNGIQSGFSNGGSGNEYTLAFTVPGKDGSSNWPMFWIGENNSSQSYSKNDYLANLKFTHSNATLGLAEGATGTLHIWDDNKASESNLWVKFEPSGYGLRWGGAGEWNQAANTKVFTVDPGDANVYWTEIVTLDGTNNTTWNYYVGLQTASGYVYSGVDDEEHDGRGLSRTTSVTAMKVSNGTSGSYKATYLNSETTGTRGKFRIWDNNITDYNFVCHFVPFYRVTYNGSGATGSTAASADVSCEGNDAARTVVAAANGFTVPTGKTFGGWASSPENAAAGVVAYAAGANVVLTSSITLYAIWTDIDYTVTVNQSPAAGATTTGQTTTAHYNTTINLTTTVPSGYRFDNWTTTDGFSITNPTSATTASFTMPNKNVTVTANFTQEATVVLSEAGNESTISGTRYAGDTYTLPSTAADCPDVGLYGWYKGSSYSSPSVAPTGANFYLPGATATLTGGENKFYAVYATIGAPANTYTKITTTGELVTGDYLLVAYYNSSYIEAMKNTVNASNYMDEVNVKDYVNNTTTPTKVTLESDNSAIRWRITKSSSTITIYNAAVSKYFCGSTGTPALNTTSEDFSYSVTSGDWALVTNSKTVYYSNQWYVGTPSSAKPIYLFKRDQTISGPYTTSPSCVTHDLTVVASPAAGGTAVAASTTIGEDKTTTAEATPNEHYTFSHWTISGAGSSMSNTVDSKSTDNPVTVTMGTEDATLTAHFTEKEHCTVVFKNNGGTESSTTYWLGEHPVAPTLVDGTDHDACDATSDKHYGWTRNPISGTVADQATLDARTGSDVVYAKAATLPAITAGDDGTTITYHAVWAQAAGSGSGNYELVEEDLGTDWAGDYLIAYSSDIFADGRIGGKDAAGSIGAQSTHVTPGDNLSANEKVVAGSWGDTYYVTLEEISENSNTYVLRTQDDVYNYQSSNANGLASTVNKATAANYPITVNFEAANDIELALGGEADGAIFHYNNSVLGSGGDVFRYYKNGGMQPIYLYKKMGGTTYSTFLTTCCSLASATGLTVSSQSGSGASMSVTLGWTAPSSTTGITKLQVVDGNGVVKVDNLANNATSATISSLTECTTYSFKVVSVGASCETPSDALEVTPFSGAKTLTFNYNGSGQADGTFVTSCGSTSTTLPTPETYAHHQFEGWYDAASGGSPIGDAGDSYGPVTTNHTIYARWSDLPQYTVTFYKGTSNTGPGTLSISPNTITYYSDDAGVTTLPTITSISCGDWSSFEGWTENGSYVSSSTPPTLITAPYKPLTNKTVYAVYKKTDGSPDFDGTSSGTYYIRATPSSTSYYASECLSTDELVSSGEIHGYESDAYKVAYTFTKVTKDAADYYNITCDGTNYLKSQSNSLTTTTTYNDDAALWSVSAYAPSGADGTGAWRFVNKSTTRNFVFTTNSRTRFVDWANGNFASSGYPLELLSASTSYYNINPSCEVTYTVTKGTCTPASSVLDVDDDYCDFSLSATSVSSGGMITVTLTPNKDYTYNASSVTISGGGTASVGSITETAGVLTCNITGITADMTVNVTYVAKPLYTVHLYDQGNKLSDVEQTHYNENVTLPSGTFCGSPFSFVGWTDNANQLAASAVKPNIVVASDGLSSWKPTAETTLYAVYSKSITTCDEFAAGVTGAYHIYYDASNYAVASATGTQYSIASSGTQQVFYIAYSSGKKAYTISTSEGYLGWNSDGSDIVKGASKPYYWTLTGSTNNWKFLPGKGAKELKCSSSNFKLLSSGTTGKIYNFEKASNTYYYTIANCSASYTVTFKVHSGASITGSPSTPGSSSYNSGTHVLSGLTQCDKVTTFPAATYDGWTFLGWSTEDYSNSGKHTADYATENASTDEPDASIIYKTGGNSYTVMGSNIELWPVFSRYPDNETFDLTQDEVTAYIYYLDESSDDGFGEPVRVYAGEYSASCRYLFTKNCTEATEFTFTKSGDYWTIKDGDDYIGGSGGSDNLTHAGVATNWTLSIYNGNQFDAFAASGRQIGARTDGNDCFMNYTSNNIKENPSTYHRVYLGSCTERIFSSEPNPTPVLELSGEPYVTSSVSQTIRATATMSLTAAHLSSVPATRVKVTGTNLKFATNATANPATPLWVDLTEGSATATIYVYYTPTATEDGVENIVVTAQAYNSSSPKDLQTTGTVHARHLPADFVIAAKLGDKWYALPSTCNSSGSSTTGVLITVDDDNDPTSATYALSTAKWGLRQTKAGSRVDGSYNDRLVFTERVTTETANSQQALYNYNSAEIYTNATYTNYNNTNPDRYEWTPVTSDFKDYTLTNANGEGRPLILRNDGEFKAQTTNQAYGGKVRLLPATFYADNVQIVEWKTNSVVVMYTGSETSAKTKVGTNSEGSAQTLSTHKLTHGVYELTTGSSLTSNAGKNLVLKFGDDVDKKMFEIPWIINGNSNATSGHDNQDVVILKNGKLTAVSTKYSYRNVYVYGGGKLKVTGTNKLGVNNIILRAGGITTSGIGSSPTATYEYVYPQVELGGELSSTKTDIKYEYVTDYDHWYQLCLPFNASLNSITYPQEYYGANVAAGNKGSWVIKRYAGEVRATGSYEAWKDIEKDSPAKTEVTAGYGYLFWGAPKKVTIGDDTQRQQWGIQRMTMSITAAAATYAETNDKSITVNSYTDVATSTKPNDQGWNLVGNPYMVNLANWSSTSMIAGELVHSDTDPWDGKWKNSGDGVRYVTIPDNHFDNYVAKTTATAISDGNFMPGRAFFVQIDKGATTLTFAVENRASLMPALFAKTEQAVDIETGIVMSDESKHDEVNFWIKDGKTAEYEYNADYPKTPNSSHFNIYGVHNHGDLSWIAISPEIAEGSMAIGYQVPTAGEYRLSLSETYVSDKIEQLLVTDHEMSPEITTDLMVEDYIFQVNQAETNNMRFTVSIKIKSGTNTATDIDDIRTDSDHPIKFLYRDKIYILRGGQIYDTTGKQVREINK